jgi:DNA repair exonuclease SbcCD nuclease subunit
MRPEQIRIAITLKNDFLIIMTFITNDYHGYTKEPTSENIELGIEDANCWGSPMKSWRIISDDELPADRTFRNAWIDKNKKIEHNMDKVREIHLEHIRRAREPILEQKDKDWMRAMGQGNTKEVNKIEKERQILRDIPQTIAKDLEKAKTPEEVKKLWPAELKID